VWASENPAGSPEALEWFSSLADDDTPALSPFYQPGGISLAQVYALMLQAAVPPGTLASSFARAMETFATVVRGSLQVPGVEFHPTWPAPRSWCDPGNDALWTSVTIGSASAAPPPSARAMSPTLRAVLLRPELMRWHVGGPAAVPHANAMAMAAVPRVTPSSLRLNLMALRPPMELPQVKPRMTVSAASAIVRPAPHPAPRPNTQPVHPVPHPNTQPVHPVPHPNPQPDGSHPVIMPTPIPHPRPPPPGPVTPQPVSTNRLGASFKYIRVSFQRPWMDTTLFHLPGWSIGGLASGAISNGHADANPGMLPLMPTGFIAIKDLVVNGAWNDADRQSARAALGGHTTASLGPFTLAAGGATLGSFKGDSLMVPGIQIVAWVCAAMPLLPPT
jgi:hypothetical protein